ncbi:hypothetical protein R6Q57_012258 [Mikania cordata]
MLVKFFFSAFMIVLSLTICISNCSCLAQYPVVSDNRLSARNSSASVIPTGILVDTNLPDTFRHLPAPIPYDANPYSPFVQTSSPEFIGGINVSDSGNIAAKETMKYFAPEEFDAGMEESGDLRKSHTPFLFPEECPTCLEEYDEENPKIITKCEHHFHLSCILEWMERSDTCPVCDQEMEVSFPIDN